MFGDFSTRFSGQYRTWTRIVSNYETKVFVNCESRPGSASVDQFDRLGDRNNTHVLFSESSLAQFGLEQLTTTHRDKKQKRCFCTRVEILIESAWTAPLWSWNELNGSLFALFVSPHNKRNCLAKNSGGCVLFVFCEEPNVFGKLFLIENPDTLFPFGVRKWNTN